MKKRSATSRAPGAQSLPQEPNVSRLAASSGFFSGFGFGDGGHLAASQSMDRGFVYWPTLDTRREISSYSRTEIMRKTRFLYANVGFARRLVNGIARMVAGTGLMPRPTTLDRTFNEIAHKRMEARYGTASVYDLAGKFNGYTAQRAKLRARFRDGDMAAVLARGADGRAAVGLYEAHQIGNGSNADAASLLKYLFDGIRTDAHNRILAGRLLREDGSAVEIPSPAFMLVCDAERIGQSRCLPIFAHAVNHLLDKTEIDAHFKGSIKQASRPGYFIQKAKDAMPTTPPRPGTAGKRETVTTLSGKKVNLEKVFGKNGGEVVELDPGEEIKMLLDDRPHPNTLGFLEYIIRDASLGVDLSPEVLWSIVKLGGAGARFVMQDAQSYVDQEQQNLVDGNLTLEYIYFLADEMALGRLPRCADPEWWKHAWIPPTRWTVDYGRDGKLHLEQLRSGALTFSRLLGWQGLVFEEEMTRWLDERAFIVTEAKRRGLDPESVLAAIYGRPSIGGQPAKDKGRTDDEEKDTADEDADDE